MAIKFYHIILAVKILGWFLLKWAGFGELLGWKSPVAMHAANCANLTFGKVILFLHTILEVFYIHQINVIV